MKSFLSILILAPGIAFATDETSTFDAKAAERFAKEAASDPAAAIGVAQCRIATGKRAEALATLEAARERFPKSARFECQLSVADGHKP